MLSLIRANQIALAFAVSPYRLDKKAGYPLLAQAIVQENKEIRERIEQYLGEQNNRLRLTWPTQEINEAVPVSSHEESSSSSSSSSSPVESDDEVMEGDLEEPELDEALEPFTQLDMDGIFHVDSELRAKYPNLALKVDRLQLKMATFFGSSCKHGIQFMIGLKEVTSQQAEYLFNKWAALKLRTPVTNNTLHYTLKWLDDLERLHPLDLMSKIEEDLSSDPKGDTLWKQYGIGGTMHKVKSFARKEPELCLIVTEAIDKVVVAAENDKAKSQILTDLKSAYQNNTDVVGGFVATGLLLFGNNSKSVKDLFKQVGASDALVFNILSCTTMFFNAIEGDSETKESLKTLSKHLMNVADSQATSAKILELFNGVLAKNPQMIEIVDATTQEATQLMRDNPAIFKGIVNAAPVLIRHPMLMQMAVSTGKAALCVMEISNKAEELKSRYNLHEDGMGTIMDFDPFEGENPAVVNANALELMRTGLQALDMAAEALATPMAPSNQEPEAQSFFSTVSEVSHELADATVSAGHASFNEEIEHLPNSTASNFGQQLGGVICDFGSALRDGKLDTMSSGEMAEKAISASKHVVLNTVVNTATYSVKKIAFDAVQGGTMTAVNMVAPSATALVPSFQTASIIYQLAKALYSGNTTRDKLENCTLTARDILITSAAGIVGARAAQEIITIPVLSALAGGVIATFLVRIVKHNMVDNKPAPATQAVEAANE